MLTLPRHEKQSIQLLFICFVTAYLPIIKCYYIAFCAKCSKATSHLDKTEIDYFQYGEKILHAMLSQDTQLHVFIDQYFI